MGKEGKGRGTGGGGWEMKRYSAQGRAREPRGGDPLLGLAPRPAERGAAAYLLRAPTTDRRGDNHARTYAHSCRKAADITR